MGDFFSNQNIEKRQRSKFDHKMRLAQFGADSALKQQQNQINFDKYKFDTQTDTAQQQKADEKKLRDQERMDGIYAGYEKKRQMNNYLSGRSPFIPDGSGFALPTAGLTGGKKRKSATMSGNGLALPSAIGSAPADDSLDLKAMAGIRQKALDAYGGLKWADDMGDRAVPEELSNQYGMGDDGGYIDLAAKKPVGIDDIKRRYVDQYVKMAVPETTDTAPQTTFAEQQAAGTELTRQNLLQNLKTSLVGESGKAIDATKGTFVANPNAQGLSKTGAYGTIDGKPVYQKFHLAGTNRNLDRHIDPKSMIQEGFGEQSMPKGIFDRPVAQTPQYASGSNIRVGGGPDGANQFSEAIDHVGKPIAQTIGNMAGNAIRGYKSAINTAISSQKKTRDRLSGVNKESATANISRAKALRAILGGAIPYLKAVKLIKQYPNKTPEQIAILLQSQRS